MSRTSKSWIFKVSFHTLWKVITHQGLFRSFYELVRPPAKGCARNGPSTAISRADNYSLDGVWCTKEMMSQCHKPLVAGRDKRFAAADMEKLALYWCSQKSRRSAKMKSLFSQQLQLLTAAGINSSCRRLISCNCAGSFSLRRKTFCSGLKSVSPSLEFHFTNVYFFLE